MVSVAKGLAHPAHAEVADLDRDGIKDVLVADLGVPMPSDRSFSAASSGSGAPPMAPTRRTSWPRDSVASAISSPPTSMATAISTWSSPSSAGVRPARSSTWSNALAYVADPNSSDIVVDPRHGTIHVPVADLDGDGRPDFVALITQEHEAVVAFLNAGDGRFKARTLYSAPHPAYGSSGIQLADLDADGDLDVLLSNGDVYDSPFLKPYHGVIWLENRGDGPFEPHPIGPVYGAHRALAGDLDGDGDLDVVATSFLGEPFYGAMRREVEADAVVIFEQAAPGRFTRHVLERESCDYPTFALGDLDSDGDLDLVAGSFRDFSFAGRKSPAVSGAGPLVIWENLGPADDTTEAHPGDR